MNHQEAIREACSIVALAFHSIGDYSRPSDGFCDRCPYSGTPHYSNSGHILEYVRLATLARLKADGYEIDKGFDPETGREVPK